MLKLIFKMTNYLKPVLVKIIPIELLRNAKKKLLYHNESQIRKIGLLPYDKSRFPKGVNLIGNIKGDSGLGQSCRLLACALENSDYPLCIVEHSISSNLSMSDTTYDDRLEKCNKYGINIFHINAHEFSMSFLQLGRKVWDYHYNIAYWLWELEEFPDEWVEYINLLDEIWTPAEYISESIRKKTNKPVVTVPYYVTAPTNSIYDRNYFKLSDDMFLFLMMFDCGSMIERKNPRAVIEAFKNAFGVEELDVGLVIKINGGNADDIRQIKSYIGKYKNIYLINGVFTKLEINSLIKCADAVVSLHRAEGFGLVLAEAMLNGVPCIATNWSANTEFMNNDVACMVDYELVELKTDIGPYKKGNRWAEPNCNQASEYMKKLYKDREFHKVISNSACDYAKKSLNLDRTTSIINMKISEINLERGVNNATRCEKKNEI